MKKLIIGLGESSRHILLKLNANRNDANFITLVTKKEEAETSSSLHPVLYCPETCLGGGTRHNPEMGRKGMKEFLSFKNVDDIFSFSDDIVIVSCLGGGNGGALPVLASHLKKLGKKVHVFVSLPSMAEGTKTRRKARGSLNTLRNSSIPHTCVPMNSLYNSYYPRMALEMFYPSADLLMAKQISTYLDAKS